MATRDPKWAPIKLAMNKIPPRRKSIRPLKSSRPIANRLPKPLARKAGSNRLQRRQTAQIDQGQNG